MAGVGCRASLLFREKQNLVDEQISEMDKLSAVINGYEKEMLRLKKQYETQVRRGRPAHLRTREPNQTCASLSRRARLVGAPGV